MKNLNKYIIEKFKISKDISNKGRIEDIDILIDFLKLTDNKLINIIIDWLNDDEVTSISVQILKNTFLRFSEVTRTNLTFKQAINTEIFKAEKSFICTTDAGNFEIMRKILTGEYSSSYKKDQNLLYESKEDNLKLYGNKGLGLYIKHKDYELVILYNKEKDN